MKHIDIKILGGISSKTVSINNRGCVVRHKTMVSGDTIRQIEDALRGKKTWNAWRDNIKSKYPNNATKDKLDVLFAFWD